MNTIASLALFTLAASSVGWSAPNPDALTFQSGKLAPLPLTLAEVIGDATRAPQPLFSIPRDSSVPRPTPNTAPRATYTPPPSNMPVVEPDPTIDYKIAIVRPDPNIDFKIRNPLDPADPSRR